jgi:hypothetical protein
MLATRRINYDYITSQLIDQFLGRQQPMDLLYHSRNTIGISNLLAKYASCSMAAARKVSAAITDGLRLFC